MDYISALNEAHNQMLELIQDGKSQMIILEQNPIHSQDAMFGVPQQFQEMLNEMVNCTYYDVDNDMTALIADEQRGPSRRSRRE